MDTARTEPPDVLDEIAALFSWNPPFLLPKHGQKKSSTTSLKSAFFEKHLPDPLVLKRVERLPSLLQDLARNVDRALDAAKPTLPPVMDSGFITARQRDLDLRQYNRKMKDEEAVGDTYGKYTARYCLPLASTLALHPTASFSEWSSLLTWTQSVSSSAYSITDGELCFLIDSNIDERCNSHFRAVWDTMEDDIRSVVEKMGNSSRALATWEMKSLDAGRAEVMAAVLNLGRFDWTTCDDTECAKNHEQKLNKFKVVATGLDARNPPWNLSSPSEAGPSTPPSSPPSPSEYAPMFSLSPLSPPTPSPPPPTKKKGKQRKRDTPSSAQNIGKKHKRDDDDDENDDNDKAYQDQHDLTAQSLVQQAWAQAICVDGTVIVLHSGNHELVCIRHRASQTLYVSEVIEPHRCVDPGYGKLHVGIYIAAIQDAVDRMQQKPPPVSQSSPISDIDADQDNNRGSGSGHKRGPEYRRNKKKGGRSVKKRRVMQGSSQKSSADSDELSIEKIIHEASNRDIIHIYFRYGVYDSPVPASFFRSAPPIMTDTSHPTPLPSPQTIHSHGPEECLNIILTSEFGQGTTGTVHRGTLEIWDDVVIPMDIIVKLAFDNEHRMALKNEYEIYRHLRLKGIHQGITTVLGFFDDFEDDACALVMVYAGVPLSADSLGNLSISDCKSSALSTLESIHLAGILHGDIRLQNILISDLGITIIDFGHSRLCDDKQAKDKELALLRYFLRLTGKGTKPLDS